MREKTITIILIALMCINSVSGYSMVLCYGQDGHVNLEPADHNHCDCDNEETILQINTDEPSQVHDCISYDHHHCDDNLVVLDIYVQKQNNVKSFIQKILAEDISFYDILAYNDYLSNPTNSDINTLSEFFIPLQTIILLT